MDSEKNSKNYPGRGGSSKNLAFSGGNIEGDTHLDDAKTSFCFLQPYLLYKLPSHRLLSHLACTSGQEQFSVNACQRRPHSHIALPHAAQRTFLYTSALSLLRSKVSHVSALSLSLHGPSRHVPLIMHITFSPLDIRSTHRRTHRKRSVFLLHIHIPLTVHITPKP